MIVSARRIIACALFLATGSVSTASIEAQAVDPDQGGGPVKVPDRLRASWLSDRQLIRVGDILTIVVDERVTSRERNSKVATGNRNLTLGLNKDASMFHSAVDDASRDVGEVNRLGDLTAVLSVRVTAIEAGGVMRVQGQRLVKIDGREQSVTLEGFVRAQDITASNVVLSNRVADVVISVKGKNISPSKGIIGKILSIFWP